MHWLSCLQEIPLNGLFGKKEFTNFYWEIRKETLTVPFQDIFEIDCVGDPLAGYERLGESPDADVHRAGSRLWSQASEVDGLLCEHIALPALALICGEPETRVREGSWQRTSMYWKCQESTLVVRSPTRGNTCIWRMTHCLTIQWTRSEKRFIHRTHGRKYLFQRKRE